MTQALQPQRQPLATFRQGGVDVPVFITVPWFRALNQLVGAQPSPDGQVTIDAAPAFSYGALVFSSGPEALRRLAPGPAGTILSSTGSAPEWIELPPAELAPIAANQLLANTSGGEAEPVGTALTALLDAVLGVNQGSIVFRNAAGWVALLPSTPGHVLTTAGAAADPAWAPSAGGGSFTYASTAPGSPSPGDVWVDSDLGILFTYIDDGNSSQWVEF